MTKRNAAITLRALTAAMLFAPLAACAAPPPAESGEQAAPAPASTPAPEAPPAPAAAAPAQSAQEAATTPRRPGETTTGRPPAPARPAPSATPANTAPVPAPLPADQAPAPAAETPATVTAPAPAPQEVPRAALPASPSGPAAGSLMQTILALALVLAVLGGLAWFLKRFAPKVMGGGNANLRLVGALNLGARERIVVVEVGNQWIVVGASPGRINALATMPRQEGVEGTAALATGTPSAGSFSDWLKNTIDKRNAK